MRPDDAEVHEGPQGDPACWAERLCDACGALEDGPPSPACRRCGRPRARSDSGS